MKQEEIDELVQKYLHKKTTPAEDKILLENLMVFYNVTLQLMRNMKTRWESNGLREI